MKNILRLTTLILSIFVVIVDARAGSPFVAYGASATSQELIAVRFDEANGKVSAKIVQREAIGIEAAPVIFHERHRLLYVASLRSKEEGGNRLLTFSVAKDGKLTKAHEFKTKHGCAYLALDHSEQFLLSASYFEGHVDIIQLDEKGIATSIVHTQFENRNKAHSIRTNLTNQFAYVPYVKDNNAMFQYSFNEKTGKVTPLDPPQAKVAKGAGPRHVAYHPVKPFVFFSNEQHLGVSAYRITKKGPLKLVGVCDPGDLKPAEGIAASDIEITADGRFLFVGVRDFAKGEIDAIHRYAVSEKGEVAHLGQTKADEIPWGLQRSLDGKHLFVTAAHGETLTMFAVEDDGDLNKRAAINWGKMVRDIALVEIK